MRDNLLVANSEIVLIEFEAQRETCCHTGGGMAWDADQNLYITIGNNLGNNMTSHTDERPGRAADHGKWHHKNQWRNGTIEGRRRGARHKTLPSRIVPPFTGGPAVFFSGFTSYGYNGDGYVGPNGLPLNERLGLGGGSEEGVPCVNP